MASRSWGSQPTHSVTDQQIVASYRCTHSGKATAEELGINWKTVYAALQRQGIRRDGLQVYRQQAAQADEKQSREIRMQYEQGTYIAEIARQRNMSPGAIRSAIQRVGGKVKRELPFATPADERRILKLYKTGWNQHKIAGRVNHSWTLVHRVLLKYGIQPQVATTGAAHHNWKGGRAVTAEGYVKVRVSVEDAQFAGCPNSEYVPEHRLIMARHLGRALKTTETVHHINGNRSDNDIDNLQLRQGRHGTGRIFVCADCGSRDIIEAPLAEEKLTS